MTEKTNILIKSRERVRDHWEVLTPERLVNDMLDLVKNETERIDSRFLEPACGDGNFLVIVLKRKIEEVDKKYKKHQYDREKNTIIAISSIYWIDLLYDNVYHAQHRLYKLVEDYYKKAFKQKINDDFFNTMDFILRKNIVQGDALTLKDEQWLPIVFAERSFDQSYTKRRDFIFDDLINTASSNNSIQFTLFSESKEPVFLPKPIKDRPSIHFLSVHTQDDEEIAI